MAKFITYYATDDTMGDNSPADCEAFRAWAMDQLRSEFPGHDIEVLDEPHIGQVRTDDDERSDEIEDYCRRLWDRCPWDWRT